MKRKEEGEDCESRKRKKDSGWGYQTGIQIYTCIYVYTCTYSTCTQ